MVVENIKKYKTSLVRKFNLIVDLYESTIKKTSIKFMVINCNAVLAFPNLLVIIVIPLYCMIVLKRVTNISLKEISMIIQSFTVVDNTGKNMNA